MSRRRSLSACLGLPWFAPWAAVRPGGRPWLPAFRAFAARLLGRAARDPKELPPLPPLPPPPDPVACRARGEAVHLAPAALPPPPLDRCPLCGEGLPACEAGGACPRPLARGASGEQLLRLQIALRYAAPAEWPRIIRGLLAPVVLVALALLAPPAAAEPPARPLPAVLLLSLRQGEQALLGPHPAPALAYRLCGRAAAPGPNRGAALVCQGRAALSLRWPARAIEHARQALREPHYPAAAQVLLGDALRAQAGRCTPEARTAYLQAREALPEDPGALAGLRACAVDLPSAPGLAQAAGCAGPRPRRRRPCLRRPVPGGRRAAERRLDQSVRGLQRLLALLGVADA